MFSKLVEKNYTFPTYSTWFFCLLNNFSKLLCFLVRKVLSAGKMSTYYHGTVQESRTKALLQWTPKLRMNNVATVCRLVSEQRLIDCKPVSENINICTIFFFFCIFWPFFWTNTSLHSSFGSQHSTDKWKFLGCRWIHLASFNHFHLKGKPLSNSENWILHRSVVHSLKRRTVNAKITFINLLKFIKLCITSLAESDFNCLSLATQAQWHFWVLTIEDESDIPKAFWGKIKFRKVI